MQIICMLGNTQSGKSSIAKQYCKSNHAIEFAFGDRLKQEFIVRNGLSLSLEEFEKEKIKERSIDGIPVRKLLYDLSVELKEKYGEDYFALIILHQIIKITENSSLAYLRNLTIVISDLRFVIELQALLKYAENLNWLNVLKFVSTHSKDFNEYQYEINEIRYLLSLQQIPIQYLDVATLFEKQFSSFEHQELSKQYAQRLPMLPTMRK